MERGRMIKVSDSTQKQQLLQTEGLTRFTGWLFEQIEPFLEGPIWEAGCGIGTYTQHLVAAGCERILASDHDEDLLEIARRRFKGIEQVRLLTLDMSREEDFAKLRGESIRTIVCLNVVEHIENDLLVLRNMRALLAPQGETSAAGPCPSDVVQWDRQGGASLSPVYGI
jgi:2-polyprenyl-3-methyl-5-hydroxy-6-metoxy-1,4-benzoquinol methylase